MTTRAAPLPEPQPIIEDMRTHLRKIRLGFILAISWAAHLVLIGAGLTTPIGIYTLLVYAILLCLVSHTLSCFAVDQSDLRDAMYTHVHPARIRTPLHIEFLPYIAVWLAWWTITELVRAAHIMYRDFVLWQFFFFPALVIFVTWARSNASPGSIISPRVADAALLVLQIVTLIVLFFPTASWAPQHNRILTIVRSSLYFFAVLLFDYAKPARAEQTLYDTAKTRATVDASVRRMMRNNVTLEGGSDSSQTAEQRREQIVTIVTAYDAVAQEHSRVYEIATLNAWILVSPLIVALLGFLCTSIIFLIGAAQHRRVTAPQTNMPVETPTPPKQRVERKHVSTNIQQHVGGEESGDNEAPAQTNQVEVFQHRPIAPPMYTEPVPIATSTGFYPRAQGGGVGNALERSRIVRVATPVVPPPEEVEEVVAPQSRSSSPAPTSVTAETVVPRAQRRPFQMGL